MSSVDLVYPRSVIAAVEVKQHFDSSCVDTFEANADWIRRNTSGIPLLLVTKAGISWTDLQSTFQESSLQGIYALDTGCLRRTTSKMITRYERRQIAMSKDTIWLGCQPGSEDALYLAYMQHDVMDNMREMGLLRDEIVYDIERYLHSF